MIGSDCAIARSVAIWCGDGHAIKDKKGRIINDETDMSVEIGDHVWIGERVSILKNSKIPDYSIIGYDSMVNKKFTETNIIIAGTPANIIKSNISWERKNAYLLKKCK